MTKRPLRPVVLLCGCRITCERSSKALDAAWVKHQKTCAAAKRIVQRLRSAT